MSEASPPSCPVPGRNSRGFASSRNEPPFPVVVTFIDVAGMLHCDRLDTHKPCIVHRSLFMPSQSIPSIFREHCFQVMAPFWADALASYPKAIVISDERWSPETLMRKLRESRVAHDRYGWTSPLVDEAKWRELSPRIHTRLVSNGDSTVVALGPDDSSTEYKAFEAVVTNRNDCFVRCPDSSTLEQFCKCVESGIFQPVPRYIIYGLTDAQVTDLESRYDIGFVKRPDGHSWEVVS